MLSLLAWTTRESGRIREEDANLHGLVLDRYWKWMHHVRDGVTQFLYKCWGLQSQERSIHKSLPLQPEPVWAACQLFPSPHLERNRLSPNCVLFVLWGGRVYRCQPTCGDNVLSEACGLSCQRVSHVATVGSSQLWMALNNWSGSFSTFFLFYEYRWVGCSFILKEY